MSKPVPITLDQLQLAFGTFLGWEVYTGKISLEEAQRQIKKIEKDRNSLRGRKDR